MSKSERDVQNEKPRNLATQKSTEEKQTESGTAAIIHTTYGDIHVRLFPEAAPKAVENFVTHAKNGYYNNIIFHRIIRKFMIQVSCIDHFSKPLLTTNRPEIPSETVQAGRAYGAANLRMSSQA